MVTKGAFMDQQVCVFATIRPHPEHLESARNAVLDIIPATLKEPGCREFRLLEQEGGVLHLYEEWTDQAALDSHYAEPYTRAVLDAYADWLAEPVSIIRMNRLG